jgi:hypothetical protein
MNAKHCKRLRVYAQSVTQGETDRVLVPLRPRQGKGAELQHPGTLVNRKGTTRATYRSVKKSARRHGLHQVLGYVRPRLRKDGGMNPYLGAGKVYAKGPDGEMQYIGTVPGMTVRVEPKEAA